MFEYMPGAYNIDVVDQLINNVPWRTVSWKNKKDLPRLVASMSVDELIECVPEMVSVIDDIQTVLSRVQSCWLNYYRNGADYTPYHRDSYNCIVANPLK